MGKFRGQKKYSAVYLKREEEGEIFVNITDAQEEKQAQNTLGKHGGCGEIMKTEEAKMMSEEMKQEIIEKYKNDFLEHEKLLSKDKQDENSIKNDVIENTDIVTEQSGKITETNQSNDDTTEYIHYQIKGKGNNGPCKSSCTYINKSQIKMSGEVQIVKPEIVEQLSAEEKICVTKNLSDIVDLTHSFTSSEDFKKALFGSENSNKGRHTDTSQNNKQMSVYKGTSKTEQKDNKFSMTDNVKWIEGKINNCFEKNLSKISETVARHLQNTGKKIVDKANENKNSILDNMDEKKQQIIRKNDQNTSSITEYIDESTRDLATKKKIDGAVNAIMETVEPLSVNIQDSKNYLETIQGKIGCIEDVLSKKGVSIRRESVPNNEDETTIANAKRLAIALIDELTNTALLYAKNRETIDNADEMEEKRNKEFYERLDKEKEAAKLDFIHELLSGYSDITSFIEAECNDIAKNILSKYGVKADEKFTCGNEFVLKEDEFEGYHFLANGLESAGKYKVLKTAYYIGDKVLQKAEIRLIENE